MSKVTNVSINTKLDELLKGDQVIINFGAEWCGACKVLEPIFNKLSTQYPLVTFLKVEIDKINVHESTKSITSIPTIMLYQKGKKTKEIVSPNETQLRKILDSMK
ncbi:hypothetical protein DDB_G0287849 [Dictyostelium discoideum AX4]|uniref:Putative thioredoxin-4 n=1 Tax=Dictyostelium discoideum TaxID=44689 RepID=THIO4_DICDI|nr:hypothetical protein DDB_G0287849 [Dictyostelium discoideum AX4]Q1ZXE0.2 RecName: Full=Putative thioredoxin-4; Short=Trx-4 [Dictyostelium discoideum]EAS66847.2 hypothetical protein DDB_G0287849 [Dictyostelium discoideum AX4]|eukprot:XP_001134530.2 hypothetical protein DDB_G0287849 [Dictyostelium discoideum AX4]